MGALPDHLKEELKVVGECPDHLGLVRLVHPSFVDQHQPTANAIHRDEFRRGKT